MHLSMFADACLTLADRRNVNTTSEYHRLYQASLVSQDIEISDKTNTGILDTHLSTNVQFFGCGYFFLKKWTEGQVM